MPCHAPGVRSLLCEWGKGRGLTAMRVLRGHTVGSDRPWSVLPALCCLFWHGQTPRSLQPAGPVLSPAGGEGPEVMFLWNLRDPDAREGLEPGAGGAGAADGQAAGIFLKTGRKKADKCGYGLASGRGSPRGALGRVPVQGGPIRSQCHRH